MSRIGAGIVLYNPDIDRLQQNIDAIISQVDALVLVDNGSNNIEKIIKNFSQRGNITIIQNNTNLGIATALNEICKWALNMGYEWVLTLDQDSVCCENMIKEFSRYANNGQIGIICPSFIMDGLLNDEARMCKQELETELIDVCITSGSLTSLKAWSEVDGFDDWMFIDCVDYDFCMRLRLHRYNILRVNSLVLNHRVGNGVRKRFLFGRYVTLFYHSEMRNYYFVRNYIYYIRKYRKHLNLSKRILYVIYWEGIKIIFEKGRIKTIRSAWKGLCDGLRANAH